MVDKRLKALTTIRRLADHELDRETVGLTALRTKIASLQLEKAELRYKAASGGRVASVESAPYVARFLRDVRAQEQKLDFEIVRLNKEAIALEEGVRERFLEAKIMRSVENAQQKAKKNAEDAQERKDLDDLVVMRRPLFG